MFREGEPIDSAMLLVFNILLIWENILVFLNLLHSRASKVHFNDLVDKVQSRLDGWINNTLNFAGRATMVQSVSSTIPSYMMQTMELPMGVCDKLDRILTVIFSEKLSIMNINSGFLFLEVSISKTTLFPIGLIKKPTSFV